jgi:uncharacterized protein involved in outer membrane biogenesis
MFRKPRNIMMAVGALLVVALLTPYINLSRFRRSVATALGTALGRHVEVGGVHVELLPLPAVVAENVVVDELPEIGSEPLARMSELRATPRLRSLWTGRPDISSVVFVEPSVNLSRAHFIQPESPRGGSPGPSILKLPESGSLPSEFPYIEVRDARINFKRDDLKSVFFFDEVQAALYRQNGALYLRFRGRPARTDRALTGAGEVRVEGQIVPRVDLQARLMDAFLNDLLALARGADPGIQGQFSVDMRITGHPAALRVEGRARVADLHRGDFLPPTTSAPLQVTFSGSADLPARRFDIAEVRSEAGTITAFGGVRGFLQSGTRPTPVDWDLQLRLNGADGGRWFTALQHFSPRLSGDFQVSGTIDGKIHFMPSPEGPAADGELTVEDLAVRAGGGAPLTSPGAKLEFDGPMVRLLPVTLLAAGQRPVTFAMALDWTTPVRGPRLLQVSASGQHLSLALFSRVAGALGWPGWPSEGSVSLNAKAVVERGSPAVFSGSLMFSKAIWSPPWLAQPVRLENLSMELAQRRVRATGLVAQLGDAIVTGSAERSVDASGKPTWQADLHANDVGAGGLASLFATQDAAPEWLSSLRASGKIATAYFHLRGFLLEDLESEFTLSNRNVVLHDAHSRLASGRVTGSVEMDFARPAPEYLAHLKLLDVQAADLAKNLAEGSISGSLELKTQGRTATELADALDMQGTFLSRSVRIQNAALASALRTERLGAVSADVKVRERTIHFKRLSFAGPPQLEASGQVGFDSLLNMDFQSFRLAGTLSEPRRIAPTELARKQDKVGQDK